MRTILLVGAVLGVSASVPLLFRSAPDVVPPTGMTAPAETALAVAPVPGPARPLRASTGASGRRVAIEADRSGHFRTELRLNGRRTEGLIDTGATYVAMNETTARRIGAAVPRSAFRHEVNTANGKARAAVIRIDSVEIGRIRLSDIEAIVLEDRALSTTLIGMNMLRKLTRFEVKDGVLQLEQ